MLRRILMIGMISCAAALAVAQEDPAADPNPDLTAVQLLDRRSKPCTLCD